MIKFCPPLFLNWTLFLQIRFYVMYDFVSEFILAVFVKRSVGFAIELLYPDCNEAPSDHTIITLAVCDGFLTFS
jgi:hypothetical protein